MENGKQENIIFLDNYKKKEEDFNLNDELYIDEIVKQIVMEQEGHTEEFIKDILSKKNKR